VAFFLNDSSKSRTKAPSSKRPDVQFNSKRRQQLPFRPQNRPIVFAAKPKDIGMRGRKEMAPQRQA
jgi:hypothetical protein